VLVEAENVTLGYRNKTVFEGVTFHFAGGVAGLVGPNGAGKTTLIKSLLGFLRPRSGTIKVCGYEFPAGVRAARSRIGYLPEGEALIPELTAVELVSYLAELSGLPSREATERAHTVLSYVGVGDLRYRKVDTYSAGMKQRVKLAQAIVHDPLLVLLDEPTDGLDPTGRVEMLELLKDLGHSKGINLIICTHLLDDVEFLADEIILINEGQIVSRKLRERLVSNRLYDVRIRGDLERFLVGMEKNSLSLAAPAEGLSLRIAIPDTLEPAIVFRVAQDTGCVVTRLEPVVETAADIVLGILRENKHANL